MFESIEIADDVVQTRVRARGRRRGGNAYEWSQLGVLELAAGVWGRDEQFPESATDSIGAEREPEEPSQ